MAPVNPPSHMQAGTYSARLDRLHTAGLLSPSFGAGPLVARSGVKPTPSNTGLQVTQRASPDKYVSVAAGTAYMAATSVLGGSYQGHNDASYDVRIPDAHASLPRKDLVVARVRDAVDDTGSLNSWDVEVVQGTAATVPVRPSTPSGAIALAEVLVPAAATAIVNANITDLRRRTVGLGGVMPCASSSDLPPTPYPGQMVYREDLGVVQVWSGALWRTIFDDGYAFTGFGTLGYQGWDCSPDFNTGSTTGTTVKYTGTTPARLNFTMPSGVPANRTIEIKHVMNLSQSSGLHCWLYTWLDAAGVGSERHPPVPADGYGYEAIHSTRLAASALAPGAHFVELRVRNDVSGQAAIITSLDVQVSLL